MKNEYEVICGNIGTVHTGHNAAIAKQHFVEYVDQSRAEYGRAAGESVYLMKNGEPVQEHHGKNDDGVTND